MRIGLVSAAATSLVVHMVLAASVASAQTTAPDPAAGRQAFNKCAVCHSADANVNKIGPSLHGIIGRHSATVANFNYSPAMKGADVTWDEATMFRYLADPRAMVPNTRMIFPGIKNEQERTNLIAYLATLK